MIESALKYASRGLAVFPCKPRDKVPLTEHGFKDASKDPGVIRAWWEKWPDANVAIAPDDETLILDVDGADGRLSVQALEHRHGKLPDTRTAKTPRGEHRWFRLPLGVKVRNRASVAMGLDVRTAGGYVVAPPSVHPSGARYEWGQHGEVAPAPDWLVDLAIVKEVPPPRPTGTQEPIPDAYVETAVERECERARNAAKGQRNHVLNAAAFSLGTLAGAWPAADVASMRARLLAAAQTAGLGSSEAERTIASGFNSGLNNPRPAPEPRAVHEPAPPRDESPGSAFRSVAERVMGESKERHEWAEHELHFGIPVLDAALGGILPHDLIILGAATGVGKTTAVNLIAESNARAGRNVYVMALEAEPREIERHIKYRRLVDAFYGAGRQFGGERLNYRDWYRGKLDDLLGEYEQEIEYDMSRDYSSLFTFYRGTKFTADDIEGACRSVQGKADLIIIDHLHYVDLDESEGENRAVKSIVKRTRDVSLLIGVPVILVAHLRKRGWDEKKETLMPDVDAFHGSSDITKIATSTVLIARSKNPPTCAYRWETYFRVPKDRMEGSTAAYVMQTKFDARKGGYEDRWVLGYEHGADFAPLPPDQWPRWAQSGGRPS